MESPHTLDVVLAEFNGGEKRFIQIIGTGGPWPINYLDAIESAIFQEDEIEFVKRVDCLVRDILSDSMRKELGVTDERDPNALSVRNLTSSEFERVHWQSGSDRFLKIFVTFWGTIRVRRDISEVLSRG